MSTPVLDDVRVIDADTHIIEPADLWTSRVSVRRWGDLVPHVRWDDQAEEEVWYFGERKLYAAGLAAMAGWHEFPPDHPRRLADCDPRNCDPVRRLEKMDEYGIHAQVLYPNVGIFAASEYLGAEVDPALVLECVRAYNDFLTDFQQAAPDRYIPIMTLPFWDLDATMAEMRRAAAQGHKGIVLPARMDHFALPDLGDEHWDPMWAQAEEMGLPVNFHIGAGKVPLFGGSGAGRHLSYAWTSSMLFMGNASAITSLVFGGICQRFPDLQFVSVESGVGWIPFLLEAMDWQFHNTGSAAEHPELELLPSEYFRRQIHSCFWFERGSARAALDLLGPDNILFETDFPHPTGQSPGPASSAVPPLDYLRDVMGDVPDSTLRKLVHDNAARLYHVDV